LVDQQAIAELRIATWRAAYAGIVPAGYLAAMDPVLQGRRRTDRFASRPATDVLYVAEWDGSIVGFAHGGGYRDDEDRPTPAAGEVYALYVQPAEQGSGVGSALLEVATAALREHGFDPLLLWVLADNAPARGFYERHGWFADGVTHTYEVGGAALPEVRYRLG
jgi:GNAT superfamily N-acetyltransferase